MTNEPTKEQLREMCNSIINAKTSVAYETALFDNGEAIARYALSRLNEAPVVPEGFVLVPKAQLQKLEQCRINLHEVWKVMPGTPKERQRAEMAIHAVTQDIWEIANRKYAAPSPTPNLQQAVDAASNLEQRLSAVGVFKGFHGLEGLANATKFWEQQPYGTRLYYGEGITEYLHIGVLNAAIRALKSTSNKEEAESRSDELANLSTGERQPLRERLLDSCPEYQHIQQAVDAAYESAALEADRAAALWPGKKESSSLRRGTAQAIARCIRNLKSQRPKVKEND